MDKTFSCNIFNENFYRVPHFWPQRSHYPLFALENYFWKYKTENIASFICHCISGNPAYGGSSPACHKARGVNLPYLDTRHAETDIWQKTHKQKKNLRFNVGFQQYADHDIYRATIVFNYMTFVENIFNFYQGGPHSPTVHITPNSPTQGWGCES